MFAFFLKKKAKKHQIMSPEAVFGAEMTPNCKINANKSPATTLT